MSEDLRPPLVMPVMMAAFAVALRAQHGGLTQHDVDDLRTKTEELMGRDDPCRAPILSFATMWELVRRDPDALRAQGGDLQRAIQWATAPAPKLGSRRDIDG